MDAIDFISIIQFLITIALFYFAYEFGKLKGKVEGFIENYYENNRDYK